MSWARTALIATAALALGLGQARLSFANNRNKPKSITQEQADQIIKELRQIRALLEGMQKNNPLQVADQRVTVRIDSGYLMGQKDAPLTLVEFADYQCPYCRQFHGKVFDQLRKNYIDTGRLRFVALDLPLEGHEYASKAATAALCAGEQFKFWEMRNALLTTTAKLNEDAIFREADELHLDSGLLRACTASNRYARKISDDAAQAVAIGISGTPSFVLGRTTKGQIEGLKIVGTLPYEDFEAKIRPLLPAEDERLPRQLQVEH